MASFRELMGRPVADVSGKQIGVLCDLVAASQARSAEPVVAALAVRCNGNQFVIPVSAATVLIAPAIPLKFRLKDLPVFEPSKDDIFLSRDVLDKQIIDMDGVRAVRVRDIDLTRVNSEIFVSSVRVRRRRFQGSLIRFIRSLLGRGVRIPEPTTIPWENVEILPGRSSMRLKKPGAKLSALHPADLADLVSDLSRENSSESLIDQLDVEVLADVLEETEPDVQADLVENMSDEKVADVLEEMAPDEAADLLAELPENRSRELLNLMQREDAEDVRKLLSFPVDSAGGLMSTDFITVPPDSTVEQAFVILRREGPEVQSFHYVYVTDADLHLLGVFSLRDLVLADPGAGISAIMHSRVVSIRVQDSQDDVAHAVSKYNLLAIPVVDDQNRMQGIITADDALDKIIPTQWKKRIPRLHH